MDATKTLAINFLLTHFQVIEITNCTEQTDFPETETIQVPDFN